MNEQQNIKSKYYFIYFAVLYYGPRKKNYVNLYCKRFKTQKFV